MKIRVEIDDEAEAQFANLDRWWRENRKAATEQLADELDRILLLLSETPDVGVQVNRRGIKHVRSVPIWKTPYLIYYEHIPGSGVATIVSVWSTMRKRGPRLPKV
jgi:hypothetical protein